MNRMHILVIGLAAGGSACSGGSSDAGRSCPGDAEALGAPREGDGEIRWCRRPDGTADGWYEERDAAGRIVVEGAFADDLADGPWTWYDAQGRPEHEQRWARGLRCGVWKSYAAGNLVSEIDFGACDPGPDLDDPDAPPTADELGVWNGLACPNGRTVHDGTDLGRPYKACHDDTAGGVRDGPYTSWNGDGSVHEHRNYRSDVPHGRWVVFWKTGEIKKQGEMAEGEKDGAWESFDPLGAKTERWTWRRGLLHGPAETYFPSGAVEDEMAFSDGFGSGTWRAYYPDGALGSEGAVVDGARTGKWLFWRADGRQRVEAWFDVRGWASGTWRLSYFVAEGDQYQLVPYEDGLPHGVVKGFWVEGDVPIHEYTWVAGLKQGAYTEWHPNGQVRVRGGYADDQLHGTWESFYPDGAPETVRTFEYGVSVGTWLWYWPNGQMKGQGSFEYGVPLDGTWTYFLEDGTPATAQEVGL
jgi:antitoxin component YwqK of YwqJK toxin-antitoxin module